MDALPPSRYQRFLRWSASRKLIIPPDTRVDPSLFSEEEFPILCPKCEYLLRGLPDARCPECGREFDRGGLLVEQYARESGKRLHPIANKWAWRMWLVGTVMMALGFILPALMALYDQQTGGISGASGVGALLRICAFTMIAAWLVGLLLLASAVVLSVRFAVISKRKRRRVLAAIDQNQPDFIASQGDLWIAPASLLGMVAAFGAWHLLSVVFGPAGSGIHPLHLILSTAVGCGIAIGIILAAGRIRRPKK